MQDTIATTNQPGLSALVAMIAAADAAGDLLVSSSRLVDALLDVRAEVEPHVVPVVDDGPRGPAPTATWSPPTRPLELVATITAGQALQADPV